MIERGIGARRRVLAFVWLAFVVTFSGELLAGKNGRSQEQVIRELYDAYLTRRLFCDEERTSRFFTKNLADLLTRPCKLDLYFADLELSDPLVGGQDWESDTVLRTLRIKPAPGQKTGYKAHFGVWEGADPTTVTYYLRKEYGEWRIFDVDGDYRLHRELSKALQSHSGKIDLG